MKKVILLIVILLCLTGCTSINSSDIDSLISQIQKSNLKLSNQTRTGYRYYLPSNLNVKTVNDFNETLVDDKYDYYLYVDLVSYYNKVNYDYETNSNCYLSKNINYNDKIGYLEVNVKNDEYLIEIMYNYAKIEVIVEKDDINTAVSNSLIILSSIDYEDDIINNMMGEDVLNSSEETLNIFDTNGGESDFLEYVQEYGTYEGDDASVPDYDLIN